MPRQPAGRSVLMPEGLGEADVAGTRGSRGSIGQHMDGGAVCDDRHAASQVALGSVWLCLGLVGTHVEGHRMIWKMNLWEGAVRLGWKIQSTSREPLPHVRL